MLCAIATDNGTDLMGRHFGDAMRYNLYHLKVQEITFQETIVNPFREDDDEDEDIHGDTIKASSMKELFLEKGVTILVSKRFGPNIRHMVKNFVPIIVRYDNLDRAKELLVKYSNQIEEMFNKGKERRPMILK